MVLQKKILLSAICLILLPFMSKGQLNDQVIGEGDYISQPPVMYFNTVPDIYSRGIFVYPDEVFDLDDGDHLIALYFYRFIGAGIDPYEISGNTNTKIYIKNRSSADLGSDEVEWNDELGDAKLVFDGPINDILGYDEGWKRFHLDEPYEFQSQDGEHLQIMFETYIEEEQDVESYFMHTSVSEMEEYADNQAFTNVDVGQAPSTLEETDSGIRPDLILYSSDVEKEATMKEVIGHDLWPLNGEFSNDIVVNFDNEGFTDIEELRFYLKAEGAMNFEMDTLITSTTEAGFSRTFTFEDIPEPEVPGEVQYTIFFDELAGLTDDTIIYTQDVSINRFGNSNADVADVEFGVVEENSFYLQKSYYNGDAEVEGVRLYIPDDEDVVGETTYGVMYDDDHNRVQQSEPHQITMDDLGTVIEFHFDFTVNVQNMDHFYIGGYAPQNVSIVPLKNFDFIPFSISYVKELNGQLNQISGQTLLLAQGMLDAEGYVSASVAETIDGTCEAEQQELIVNVSNQDDIDHSDFEIIADISGENADTVLSATYDGQLSVSENDELSLGYFNSISTGDVEITLEFEDDDIGPDEPFSTDITFNELPDPGFSWEAEGLEVSFQANLDDLDIYHWDMGDGNTSEIAAPVHTYSDDDTYQVTP